MKSCYVLLLGLCLYGLSIGTALYSSDGQVMYATGRALAFEQTIALPENYGLPQISRQEQHWYSQYDPGFPLLAAPVIWLSDALAASQQWHRYAFSAYAVMWLSVLGAALGVMALTQLSAGLYDKPTTLIIALSAACGTPLWVYARQFFAEAWLAGLITLAFLLAYRKRPLWASAMLGVAILTRAAMVIYIVPLVWLLIHDQSDADAMNRVPTPNRMVGTPFMVSEKIVRLLKFSLFPTLAILGLFYHNLVRSGDPLTFGYGGQAFETPPWQGVVGLLFSPGKSVFLYAPPLLLSVLGWRRLHRRVPALAESLLIAAGIALLFYGSWWAWHGGWCWGPRFLVPLMPLWVLPMGEVIQQVWTGGHNKSRPYRVLAFGLLILAFSITFLGTFTDINAHYARHSSDDVVHYTLNASPLVGALREGEWIPLAALHLQDMGWTPASAIIFPAILGITFIVVLTLIIFQEITHEQQ